MAHMVNIQQVHCVYTVCLLLAVYYGTCKLPRRNIKPCSRVAYSPGHKTILHGIIKSSNEYYAIIPLSLKFRKTSISVHTTFHGKDSTNTEFNETAIFGKRDKQILTFGGIVSLLSISSFLILSNVAYYICIRELATQWLSRSPIIWT